jgi:hypothetical protein
VADRLQVKDGMLCVDEDEVMTGGLGDAGYVGRPAEAHIYPERHVAGLHPRPHIVGGHRCVC